MNITVYLGASVGNDPAFLPAVSLGHLNAPCILYNLDGYYNDLKALLEHMIDKGLSSLQRQQGIYFADDLCEIASIIGR